MFFRNKHIGQEPTLNRKFIEKSVRPPKRNKIYESRDEVEPRPQTSMEKRILVPYIDRAEKNPGRKLKNLLFDTIVKHRIYKEDDLQDLFTYTREANNHVDYSTLEGAISTVYQDFNS